MKKLILLLFLIPLSLSSSTRGKTFLAFDGPIPLGALIASDAIQMETYEHVSAHFLYPAGNTGACTLEASNDKKNWVTINATALSLGQGNDIINKANLGSKWVRAACQEAGAIAIANMKIYIGAK